MKAMNIVNGRWLRVESGSGNGLMDYWSLAVPDPFCVAGPEADAPNKTREVGKAGKSRTRRRSNLRKRLGFSHFETAFIHLSPHNSTQVVDFPHLSAVRLFGEALKSGKAIDTKIVRPGKRGSQLLETKAKSIISTHQDILIFTLATPFKRVMIESRESEQ